MFNYFKKASKGKNILVSWRRDENNEGPSEGDREGHIISVHIPISNSFVKNILRHWKKIFGLTIALFLILPVVCNGAELVKVTTPNSSSFWPEVISIIFSMAAVACVTGGLEGTSGMFGPARIRDSDLIRGSEKKEQITSVQKDIAAAQQADNLKEILVSATYIGTFLDRYLLVRSGVTFLVIERPLIQEYVTAELLIEQIKLGWIKLESLSMPFIIELTPQEMQKWQILQDLLEQIKLGRVELEQLLTPLVLQLTPEEMQKWQALKDILQKIGLQTERLALDKEKILLLAYPRMIKEPKMVLHKILAEEGKKRLVSDIERLMKHIYYTPDTARVKMAPEEVQLRREQLLEYKELFISIQLFAEVKDVLLEKEKVSIAQIMAEYKGIPRQLAYDLGVYKQLWPLYVLMAELVKPEILKMVDVSNERARKIRQDLERIKTDLKLKMPQPVEGVSASGGIKPITTFVPPFVPSREKAPGKKKPVHISPLKEAIEAYRKQQKPRAETGTGTVISSEKEELSTVLSPAEYKIFSPIRKKAWGIIKKIGLRNIWEMSDVRQFVGALRKHNIPILLLGEDAGVIPQNLSEDLSNVNIFFLLANENQKYDVTIERGQVKALGFKDGIAKGIAICINMRRITQGIEIDFNYVFHELLEFFAAKRKITDEQFAVLTDHQHFGVIEEEVRFILLMGRIKKAYNMLRSETNGLKGRFEQLSAVEREKYKEKYERYLVQFRTLTDYCSDLLRKKTLPWSPAGRLFCLFGLVYLLTPSIGNCAVIAVKGLIPPSLASSLALASIQGQFPWLWHIINALAGLPAVFLARTVHSVWTVSVALWALGLAAVLGVCAQDNGSNFREGMRKKDQPGIRKNQNRSFPLTKIILLLVMGLNLCFGPFGGYANAEDLVGVKKVVSFEKKPTVEDHLRKKIMELEKSGHEEEARKTRNLLEGIIQLKRGTYPKYIPIKKKDTVEGNLSKEIMELEESGHEEEARKISYRIEAKIQ